MSPPLLSLPVEELVAQRLRAARLASENETIGLQPHAPAYPRSAELARSSFRVSVANRVDYHICLGAGLAETAERARAFAEACPELACGVVTFLPSRECDLLVLEYFAGESLDDLVYRGDCSATEWLRCVRHAQAVLERTRNDSVPESRRAQVDRWAAAIASLRVIPDDEMARITRCLFAPDPESAPSTRWTNGDFTGRNLLRNDRGEIRLVDYEFATASHFPGNDWRRLLQFSVLPDGVNEDNIPECQPHRQPLADLAFWFEHLALLAQVTHTVPPRDLALILRHIANAFYLQTGGRLSLSDSLLHA